MLHVKCRTGWHQLITRMLAGCGSCDCSNMEWTADAKALPQW